MKKSIKIITAVLSLSALLLSSGCNFSLFIKEDEIIPTSGTTQAVPVTEAPSQYTQPAFTQDNNSVIATTVTDTPTQAVPVITTEAPTAPVDAALSGDPTNMTTAEQLEYFNTAVNRIKSSRVGFTKTKSTATKDIKLSNSLANSLVSVVKNMLLSDTAETTTVNAGESSDPIVSPSNMSYVSKLSIDDVDSVSVQSNGSGYTIIVNVKGETNPGKGSICSRIFDYITVDDVENTYAPKVGATVAREDIEMVFANCYAKATVDANGNVTEYETYVEGTMNLKNAKIRVINTDVSVVLASTTRYTDMKYSLDVEF